MIAPNYKIKKPIFGTYEDLDEIVESVFKLFEDFKKAIDCFVRKPAQTIPTSGHFFRQRAAMNRRKNFYGDFDKLKGGKKE